MYLQLHMYIISFKGNVIQPNDYINKVSHTSLVIFRTHFVTNTANHM